MSFNLKGRSFLKLLDFTQRELLLSPRPVA